MSFEKYFGDRNKMVVKIEDGQKKSWLDWCKEKELEEVRKVGMVLVLMDEEGK